MFAHLPADITKALNDYDAKVADGSLSTASGFAVLPGNVHPELWTPGNALDYFISTGGIAPKNS